MKIRFPRVDPVLVFCAVIMVVITGICAGAMFLAETSAQQNAVEFQFHCVDADRLGAPVRSCEQLRKTGPIQ